MNPSTALAQVLVDELVRGGLREAVLSPGSRSAPLAFALYDADRQGRLRLHVRIDERSAAFLALGLAKQSGAPVAVVTTSGTATANLHPAVLEASHAGVALLLLTADRPPELRGAGANQTVDQVKLYGDAVRLFAEVGAPDRRPGQNAYWRSLVCRALVAATGSLGSRPGPVHLNLGLRDPLTPGGADDWPEPLTGREDGGPWTALVPAPAAPAPVDDLPARTVLVLGDARPAQAGAALALAAVRGWPVVAEPSSSASAGSPGGLLTGVLDAPDLVLSARGFLPSHLPERVLVVGRPTLSRAVGALIASAPSDVVGSHGQWPDPGRQARRVLPGVPGETPAGPDDALGKGTADRAAVADGWLRAWQAAGVAAASAVSEVLDEEHGLPEPVVAQLVMAAGGSLVVVGSSKPVRDLFLVRPRPGTQVIANRGAAGIDGTVSTAMGAALSHQRDGGGHAYALLGDLTFLHDANGLVLGPQEPRPDLTIVVVNNDGGAIFGTLEQGAPGYEDAFERVFGTPHGVDLAALCGATSTPYVLAGTREELRAALIVSRGVRVVEVRTDRRRAVALDRKLRDAAAAALAPLVGGDRVAAARMGGTQTMTGSVQ